MSRAQRRLLVTGGAGFIGTNFVHYRHRSRPHDFIVVLDALTYAGNLAGLEPLLQDGVVQFVQGDICDTELVVDLLERHQIDTVVHFAAESHVDRSIAGPDAFVTTNVLGTHSLLKAARKVWLEKRRNAEDVRFHHISTDEVFGSLDPEAPAFREEDPYAPNSPYAATKAAADHLVRAYHHTYGLPVVTTNCSNNYGPYQYPEKLLPLMLINALAGKPLPIYGDGRNVRDWLYVEDHCRGIELVLDRGQLGRTYNIGGESERANIDLVNSLCAQLDAVFAHEPALRERFPDCPAASGGRTAELIRFVADRPGHDRRYAINPGRIRSELGFAPSESLASGLRKTVAWYLDHEDWWRGLMKQTYQQWLATNYGNRGLSAGG